MLVAVVTRSLSAQDAKERYQWHVKPFRVIGNVYYIGLNDYASWLITTPQGHFLIDVEVPDEARRNLEELGFNLKDVKYLLQSHAHTDRVLGLVQMKVWTGAKVLAMEGDVPILAVGAANDNHLPGLTPGPNFPPIKVDGVLHDGEKLQLGGVTLVAHLTAGHTPGSTTWTTVAEENGKKYNVVFVGGTGLTHPLVENKDYPTIAEDWAHTYKTLRSLHGDVLLAEHASMFKMFVKLDSREKHPETNPFIDPKEYQEYVATSEKAFQDQLQREKAGGTQYPRVIVDDGPCPKDGRACYNIYDLIVAAVKH